ncbi:MAG: DUF2180 family protein [Candidatus Bathyarchaeota archaeon]|nr:DUF2180 family protein [Candidatus Bathyarchaeota archaeon]
MKCWLHPKVDAVAVCKSCGKGLCKDCAITISGQSYCKECIEKGVAARRVTTTPEPIPTPTGVPTKGFFIVGGIGSIMNVVAAILLFFGTLWFSGGWRWYRLDIIDMSGAVLVFIGTLLAGIGYLGIRRNYGSAMGTASFAMGIVTGLFFIVQLVVNVIAYSSYDYYHDYYDSPWYVVSLIVFLAALVIFGASQIIWGATHIVTRKFVNSGLSLATGILLIIAGSLTASFLLSFIGIILFLAAEIMVTILFFISKVPTLQA